MKTIGLLGGMSWESTVTYYQQINWGIQERLGGLHSAKCVLYSVDFDEIERCQASGDWQRSAQILGDGAYALERAGADFILICTNTMHKVADQVQRRLNIPLVHIGDVTAQTLVQHGIGRAALLGTRYTMEQAFYRDRLTAAGIQVLIPGDGDRARVNAIIFDELCLGIFSPAAKRDLERIIGDLADQGAQGVILGCTEIGLLLSQKDIALPLFDTALLHAQRAVALALE